jgi:PKD repeat protein
VPVAVAVAAAALAPVAGADHAQPTLQPALMDYTPIGWYGPDGLRTVAPGSATVPTPSGGPPPLNDPNPSGKWVAYDTDVWEALSVPSRHPGDNCTNENAHPDCRDGDKDDDTDITGYAGPNGVSPVHGTCPPFQGFGPWGMCFNGQLEWLDYYEESMREMLSDVGVAIHRYPFWSAGAGLPRGAPLAASAGQAYNIAAVVPGADHPEETVLVSGHYDFTDSGPAAAWDSAEGHTEVMRMAYVMADYWRKTGTRPSATIKFIPWDSEESGTFGSIDYVANNIPPGQEGKVRGYFNVDPCAGAYPAYKDGDFNTRVPEVLQLANPANAASAAIRQRMETFNARAETLMDELFDRLDDTLRTPTGARQIFVSDAEAAGGENGGDSQRDEVVTALGGLAAFSSDYANFESAGIPIFNLFPDLFGPHADDTPASAEGVSILHTNNDNLTRLNRLTSALTAAGVPDPTGNSASEGWAKGMEMCAQANSQFMLQPEMAGAQTAPPGDVVAYFEALPNEAGIDEPVTFDASGSHEIVQVTPRQTTETGLTYQWSFGDGETGSGKTPQHAYDTVGSYTATLTVTGPGGQSDTMSIPIVVPPPVLEPPALQKPPAEDADGTFPLSWAFGGTADGLTGFAVDEAPDFLTLLADDAEGSLGTLWTAEPSPDPAVQPWQKSDSSQPKPLGNKRASGQASYWTGSTSLAPSSTNVSTTLTLKQPLSIPAGSREPLLTYQSLFMNEDDDEGRVEVALEDGSAETPLEWETADVVQGLYVTSNPDLEAPLAHRAVDLSAYKDKQIFVRFRYVLGPTDRIATQANAGWYVDDIRVQAGSFRQIATTPADARSFEVTGRTDATYGYRVRALYEGGVETPPSNAEPVTVSGNPEPEQEPQPEGDGGVAGGTGGSQTPADVPRPAAGGPFVAAVPRLLGTAALTLSRGRYVNVPAACPAAAATDCTGVLTLTVTIGRDLLGGRAARIKLGSKRFRIAPGRTTRIRVRLGTKSRRLVQRARRLRVTATIASPAAGSQRLRRTFILRAGRR